jgi:hypothetical protein
MFNKDPAMQAALMLTAIIGVMIVAAFAAVALIPIGIAFGAYKWWEYSQPIPTYEPPPAPPVQPFELTDRHLREHVAIFAPSGWGKTQFLENLIVYLIDRPEPPALFILDSQGNEFSPDSTEQTLLYKLERLGLLLDRRLEQTYVIDPSDRPALNFFSFKDTSSAEVEELFSYLFSTLEFEISAPQANVIRWLMRLMEKVEQPTIMKLLDILESDEEHPAVAELDDTAQKFFRNQFYKKKGASVQMTRTALAQRCYGILGSPHLEAMFSAQENVFDAAQIMRDGSWCFVSTSTKHLRPEISALFGRFFIAQILSACYSLGVTNRLRAVLVLDEAFEYFDDKTERILSQARKYGLGLVFATQHLNQMDGSLRKAVFGNTAVQVVGRVGTDDANALAKEMDVPAAEIRGLKQDRAGTTFLVAARGMKPTLLSVSYGALDALPMMTEEEHDAFRALNRERLAPSTSERSEPLQNRKAPPPGSSDRSQHPPFKKGDRVQVTLDNVDQFAEGVLVTAVRSEGIQTWVFVEGSAAGVPLASVRAFETVDETSDADRGFAVRIAARIEQLLVKEWGATGRGLHEKFDSIGRRLPSNIIHAGRYVASVRNAVIHENAAFEDRERFVRYAKKVEDYLKQHSAEPSDLPRDTEY